MAAACRYLDGCPSYPMPYASGQHPDHYEYHGKFPGDFVWGVGEGVDSVIFCHCYFMHFS